MILAGKPLTNMYNRYGDEQKKRVNTIIEFIESVAVKTKKDFDGKSIPNEKFDGLMEILKSEDFPEIKDIVKDEIGELGICSDGIIDVINSQIFKGNDFQTYFVLTNLLRSGNGSIKLGNDRFIYKQMRENIENAFKPVKRIVKYYADHAQTQMGIAEEDRIK